MDDLTREKRHGFSYWYMKDVLPRRILNGQRYHTPGFGLASQLFAVTCRHVMENMGQGVKGRPSSGRPWRSSGSSVAGGSQKR